MTFDQYAHRGETYIMCTDSNGNVFFRPEIRGRRRRGKRQGRNRWKGHSYRSDFRHQRRFMGHKGYIPDWFIDLFDSVWDRMKLIWITAIASPILFLKLPLVLELFQP